MAETALRPTILDTLYESSLATQADLARFDFSTPAGDPGYFGPGSVTWVVFSNPLSMAMGGIAATILELAEPRVRAGVWNHSAFRTDPRGRVQRTGIAALVTGYAGRAQAEELTSRVRRMHDQVRGVADNGQPYYANDPELLRWVHATAAWGFLKACRRFVHPNLSHTEQDRYYAEGVAAAKLYGIEDGDVPTTRSAMETYLLEMASRLEPSDVLDEFMAIVRNKRFFMPTLSAQRLILDASIDLLPRWARKRLGMESNLIGRAARTATLSSLAAVAAWGLNASPAHQACARVGADPAVLRQPAVDAGRDPC